MRNAYIFPYSGRNKNKSAYNPYIDDFVKSLSGSFRFLNLGKPSKTGVFDILKYIFKLDYIFFHWIEKLPEKKGGISQVIMFTLLMYSLRIFRIKVVWTMHNKFTHTKTHKKLTRFLFKVLLIKSHLILTHSSEGISFGKSLETKARSKIKYYPHPIKDRRQVTNENKSIDILIWGSIIPYKSIDLFLEYWTRQSYKSKYKILVVGRATSKGYLSKINRFSSKSITIKNEFISNEQLVKYINDSKVILFTYSKTSILSSGALMDSLGYGAKVIGPNVGGFADLAKVGIVTTFQSFDEIEGLLKKKIEKGQEKTSDALEKFLKENTWEEYAKNVMQFIN
ncbi:MAG: glycosyltransferase [Bacteroidales bacterium]|nr:glycosyltransferase [Bacteroidales bacterium]MCF8405331.1 glycosyltransferase [Bacteroidales bacterium]